MNVCGQYNDMSAMASRTLIINPTKSQKEANSIAIEALTFMKSALKIGTPLNKVFVETIDFIKDKSAQLAETLHKNLGFGIGYSFKEDMLIINETNETKV